MQKLATKELVDSKIAIKTGADEMALSLLAAYMSDFLMQTYLVALPIILTSFFGYVVWFLKQQKKDRDANSKGTMLLLRVQLIEYHDKYVELGEIPSYVYNNFIEMYEAYHDLGGNGMVTKMYEEIQELHLRTKNGGNHNE